MDKIKLGLIGLGQRGGNLTYNLKINFPEVDFTAVCDVYQDRVDYIAQAVYDVRGVEPKKYLDYKDLLADEEVNTVIISAAWEAHVPLAIDAMKAGKAVGLEVGGAYSIDDCYKLVHTYEETKTPFMFLENCCYGKAELMVYNMVKSGVFGEVVYCHGAYCHDLRKEICGGIQNRHYRLRNYISRNCDNYPTHELGPIAKLLNINCGNRMVSLTSFSSKSRGLEEFVKGKEEYSFLQGKHFAQGDIVFTNIKCADGSLITLKLDTTLMRGYSRELSVSGTKALYNEQGNVLVTDQDTEFNHEHSLNEMLNSASKYEDKYLPSVWKEITEEEIKAGHGGMDVIMLRQFFKHLLENKPMPIDVYDAATWMSISCLSEESLANGCSVAIPDFTSGKWVINEPKAILMK